MLGLRISFHRSLRCCYDRPDHPVYLDRGRAS
jgi:hypothetical protein